MSGSANSAADRVFGGLFGDWLFGGTGGLETTLSHLLSLLSIGALAFYSLIVLYIVLAGLIKASARGSAVGKWHGGWVPFRLLFSAMLIMPMYSGGAWGGAQMMLLSIARAGSSLADWTAARTVREDLLTRYKNGDNFAIQPSLASAQKFVDSSLAAARCIFARYDLDNPQALRPGDPGYDRWFGKVVAKCDVPYQYFDTNTTWQPASSNHAFNVNDGLPWASTSADVKSLADALVNRIVIAHNEEWFYKLFTEYAPRIYNPSLQLSDTNNPAALKLKVLKLYYSGLQEKLNKGLADKYKELAKAYTDDINTRGWFYIFTSQQDIARISQYTQSLVDSRIEQMTPQLKMQRAVLKTDQLVNMSVSEAVRQNRDANDRQWYSILVAKDNVDDMKKWVLETIGIQPLIDARSGKIDPLVAMSRSGSALFNLGMAAWIGGKAADVVSTLPGVITDTVVDTAMFIVVVGALFLLISYLPILFGVSAILRWLVHVVEMLVAAPFWAAAHAAPDGDSHTSRLAAKGYNNLLFIILFPVLVVSGFFAAIQISGALLPFMLDFVQVGVLDQVEKTQQFMIEPGRYVIFFGVMVFVCWVVIHGSYQLIESLPTAILSWISDSAPGLNPFSSRGERAVGGIGMIVTRGARLPTPRGGPRPPAGRTPPRGPGAA